MVKRAKIGVYGDRTRALQKRMSYEAVSLTWKTANVYRYLGSRANLTPDIKDIQITTFMETPDRAYDVFPVEINIYFEPRPEQAVDYSQFGIIDPIGSDQIIKVHVNSYADIGRSLVEGDVIDVPFFKQGDADAMWEVIDVDDSQEREKYYSIIKLKVLEDSRETRELDVTNSIGPTLDEITGQQETEADEYVSNSGVDDSDITNNETNPDLNTPYEGTSKNRKTFLDEFDGDLI